MSTNPDDIIINAGRASLDLLHHSCQLILRSVGDTSSLQSPRATAFTIDSWLIEEWVYPKLTLDHRSMLSLSSAVPSKEEKVEERSRAPEPELLLSSRLLSALSSSELFIHH